MKCATAVYPSINYSFMDPFGWGTSYWWGRLDYTRPFPNNQSDIAWWAASVNNAVDSPATKKCPNNEVVAILTKSEHQMLIEAADVNQTLIIGLIVLFALLGFALGYYFMGPRRRSLVEVV